MPIDPSKIKPGDTVRVRVRTRAMEKAGVDPIEFTTVTHPGIYQGDVHAGSDSIDSRDLTILEHIPARPDWADALVVRDTEGHTWGKLGRGNDWVPLGCPGKGTTDNAALAEYYGPITVVLDADGNAPRPEVDPYAADFAWSHYRKEYAPNPGDMATAHKAFHAGWEAALHA